MHTEYMHRIKTRRNDHRSVGLCESVRVCMCGAWEAYQNIQTFFSKNILSNYSLKYLFMQEEDKSAHLNAHPSKYKSVIFCI